MNFFLEDSGYGDSEHIKSSVSCRNQSLTSARKRQELWNEEKNCNACASTTTVSFAEETKSQRITEDLDSRDVRPHPR